jgi:hypothetical protein
MSTIYDLADRLRQHVQGLIGRPLRGAELIDRNPVCWIKVLESRTARVAL